MKILSHANLNKKKMHLRTSNFVLSLVVLTDIMAMTLVTSERVNFNKIENKTKNVYYLVDSMHVTAHDKNNKFM